LEPEIGPRESEVAIAMETPECEESSRGRLPDGGGTNKEDPDGSGRSPAIEEVVAPEDTDEGA
jgi:hypothetical protein